MSECMSTIVVQIVSFINICLYKNRSNVRETLIQVQFQASILIRDTNTFVEILL